jgi:F-type H+-transporting ATPase subunit b
MFWCKGGINMKAKSVSLLVTAALLLAVQGVAWCSGGEASQGGHALNWADFLFRLLNFGIMLAILVWLLKKPAGNFFTSRREDIKKLLAELESKRTEAEAKGAEYQAKLAALEVETKAIVSELIMEGETEKKKIIEAAERQAVYLKEQAKLAAQQEIKAARDGLQAEISELSVTAAETLLRKNIKADDQERLVRDFMTKVVEAK